MIRNEADVLEAMLRYNLRYLDEIHVVNHLSTDASAEIVTRLQQEGLPVHLEHEHHPAHNQNRVLTGLMRRLATSGEADFIVPLDADECLAGTAGDPRALIEALPTGLPSRVKWRTYVPFRDDPATEPNHLRRITHHLETEVQQFYKVIIPRRLAGDTRYSLGMGSHSLIDERRGKSVKPVHDAEQLRIAHFPVRSADQITARAFTGWLAIASKPDRATDECYHWKRLYDRFASGALLSDDELTHIAANYVRPDAVGTALPALVRTPLLTADCGWELKYTDRTPRNPLGILAQLAEALAEEVATLKREQKTAPGARTGILGFFR